MQAVGSPPLVQKTDVQEMAPLPSLRRGPVSGLSNQYSVISLELGLQCLSGCSEATNCSSETFILSHQGSKFFFPAGLDLGEQRSGTVAPRQPRNIGLSHTAGKGGSHILRISYKPLIQPWPKPDLPLNLFVHFLAFAMLRWLFSLRELGTKTDVIVKQGPFYC